jgi:hypothetical protein
MTIAAVDAGWLLDSRATPTIEVTVTLTDGSRHRAMAPAGASTGSHESAELRDLGDPRWRGRGVNAAVAAARQIAGPALAGLAPDDQAAIDARLVEADGTARRDRLGANTMVAASVACARAGAAVTGRELWQHLGDGRRPLLPVPMVNILSGNLHAAGMTRTSWMRLSGSTTSTTPPGSCSASAGHRPWSATRAATARRRRTAARPSRWSSRPSVGQAGARRATSASRLTWPPPTWPGPAAATSWTAAPTPPVSSPACWPAGPRTSRCCP